MYKVVTLNKTEEVGPVHAALIIDRSGSMSGTLNKVIDNVQEVIKSLRPGDYLSVGWFSSEGGEFEYLINGLQVSPASAGFVAKSLDSYRRVVGCTCFSEILNETIKVVSAVPAPAYLFFFTDGYPVVSNTKSELSSVRNALTALKNLLSGSMFIGYGSYFNTSLMAEMAEFAGGASVPVKDIDKLWKILLDFAQNLNPPKTVVLEDSGFYFTESAVFPLQKGENRIPSTVETILVKGNDGVLEGYYAEAILALQKADVEGAVEWLAKTGDVRLIKLVSTALTNAEVAGANVELMKALNGEGRFLEGINTNFLPAPDAFCVLDLLNLLLEDPEAKFYPRQMIYNRIGVARPVKDGYPKFEYGEDQGVSFNKLTWNESQANLSVLAAFNGTVNLGPNDVGLPEVLDVVKFNNYALIKDGVLNVEKLPISCNKALFKTLAGKGMVSGRYRPNGVYTLDLTKIPLLNKVSMALPTFTTYVGLKESELAFEAQQKVIRYLIGESPSTLSPYTEEQQAFLAEKGISAKGVYSPPTEAGEVTDFYLATEFKVTKKGYSSWPKISDVLVKVAEGKPLSGPSELLYRAYVAYAPPDSYAPESSVELELSLESVRRDLARIRTHLNRVLFGVVVGRKWFPDATTRDGLTYKDWTVKFNTEKRVQI